MIYIKVYSKRGNIMHHWKSETIHGIETIYDNKKYRPYANAIDDGEINNFSQDLHGLLRNLASIMITEFEIKNMGHSPTARSHVEEKLRKILEMAAVGGKTL